MVSSIPINPVFSFVADGGGDYILVLMRFTSTGFSQHSSATHYQLVSSFEIKIDDAETAFFGRKQETWDTAIDPDFISNHGDFLAYASSYDINNPSPPIDYAALWYVDLAKVLETKSAKETTPTEEDEIVEFDIWSGTVGGPHEPDTVPFSVEIAVYEGGKAIEEIPLGSFSDSTLTFKGERAHRKTSEWSGDVPLLNEGRVGDVLQQTFNIREFPETITEGAQFTTRGHYVTHVRYNVTTKELSFFGDPPP